MKTLRCRKLLFVHIKSFRERYKTPPIPSFTILLAANAVGNKIQTSVIGKAQKPRCFYSGFPPVVKGGNWTLELNEIRGERKFFKIKGGRKRRGKEEFLKFS